METTTTNNIGKYFRERIVQDIRKSYDSSKKVVFVEIEKLDAFSLNQLRNNLRDKKARIVVSKNTLIKKAFGSGAAVALDEKYVKGSTGIIFMDGDPVDACKMLVDFAKDKESFKIKGGILEEQNLDESKLKALAKLPSQVVLRGMCVNVLASALGNCVGVLNNILVQFVLVINAIHEKKEKGQ